MIAVDGGPQQVKGGAVGVRSIARERSLDICDSDAVLTAEDAANFLKLSPRTLEKWRSEGAGPPVLRMGRRIAYARRDLVRWLAEQEARGRKESSVRDELEVTCRPYFKDRTRQHVDIHLTHPLDPAQPVRRRIVAPVGMDAVAATEWGRAEAFKLYRELCREPAKVDNVERKEGESPKHPNHNTVKTLAEFWPQFLAGHVAELKHSSKLNYESAWALHIREVLGPIRLDEIDEKLLSRLRKRMRQELNLSYSYTRQICESVSVALRYAQSEGELPKGHDLPELTWAKQRKPKVEVYSREGLERFIAVAKNEEERALHLLLTDGALRIGECAGLMWKDISLSEHTMEVTRCVSRGVLQDTAKGEDGVVPLSPRLVEALRGYRPRGDFVFVPDGEYSPHSFPRERREYVLEGTLGMRVRRAQGLARLAVYGPHRIRHSVLTLLARMGVSPYALQALARHARMATTMKYYIHLNQGELAAQAVAALADPDAFGNAKATRGNTPEFTLLT
ncbi:tyrosine-type recombinase/integrase [Nannocystis pusilla]|uniref:Tyrosine-type recombinase/integrase n=1 Tax=Nannocystis pusilla TaxID=889268 RepID=A0ABS7TM13_9BACT|nr:tyrosine-type recombinase/integrase [Nannocystis pusilla]